MEGKSDNNLSNTDDNLSNTDQNLSNGNDGDAAGDMFSSKAGKGLLPTRVDNQKTMMLMICELQWHCKARQGA